MTDTTFDPAATERAKSNLALAASHNDEFATIRAADLEQLLDRLDWRNEEAQKLAEAAHNHRDERDEARNVVRALVSFMRIAEIDDEELAAMLNCSPNELPTWFPADGTVVEA